MAQVRYGKPITTEQAVHALLLMIKSPILGDITKERPGRTLERIFVGSSRWSESRGEFNEGALLTMLSRGEQNIATLAHMVWHQNDPIGGMDKDNRRRAIIILAYLYLGDDSIHKGFKPSEFANAFGEVPDLQDIE